ncbi:hypothetical protein NDU88_001516 [Pleurodeles waltl]|uniref:Uncharacterized protein n=1 Tax=Pleurodeles waltl TaxID=8319 RepID=A0AAV7SZR7_PLEWA|nr:hypothetical protein NDU88_001516 [Pleurodeles waltl]
MTPSPPKPSEGTAPGKEQRGAAAGLRNSLTGRRDLEMTAHKMEGTNCVVGRGQARILPAAEGGIQRTDKERRDPWEHCLRHR